MNCWAIYTWMGPVSQSPSVLAAALTLNSRFPYTLANQETPEILAPPKPSIYAQIPTDSLPTNSADEETGTIGTWVRERLAWLALQIQTRWERWTIAVLATVALFVTLWVIRSIFPRLDRHIQSLERTYIRSLRFQEF